MGQQYRVCHANYLYFLSSISYLTDFLALLLGVCETGWEAYGLFCYYFSAEALTFAEAEVACESNFASLAYIDDNGENVFLFGNGYIPNMFI